MDDWTTIGLGVLAPLSALAGVLATAYVQRRSTKQAAEAAHVREEAQRKHATEMRRAEIEREERENLRQERLQAHTATLAALWALIVADTDNTTGDVRQRTSQLGHAVALSAVVGGPRVRRTAPRAMWSVLRWVQRDEST